MASSYKCKVVKKNLGHRGYTVAHGLYLACRLKFLPGQGQRPRPYFPKCEIVPVFINWKISQIKEMSYKNLGRKGMGQDSRQQMSMLATV